MVCIGEEVKCLTVPAHVERHMTIERRNAPPKHAQRDAVSLVALDARHLALGDARRGCKIALTPTAAASKRAYVAAD